MKIKQHLRVRFVILLVVFAAGLMPSVTIAQSGSDRIEIELAMREYNARFNTMSKTDAYDPEEEGDWYAWPPSKFPGCGCTATDASGNFPATPKPENLFYGPLDDPAYAVEIVEALVTAFYAGKPNGGTTELYELFMNPDDSQSFAEADFPMTWVSGSPTWTGNSSDPGVDAENYRDAFDTVFQYIKDLYATHTGGSAVWVDREELVESGAGGGINAATVSEAVYLAWQDLVDNYDAPGGGVLNTYPGAGDGPAIAYYVYGGAYTPFSTAFESYFTYRSGSLRITQSTFSGLSLGGVSADAKVIPYLKAEMDDGANFGGVSLESADVPDYACRIPVDGKWHPWPDAMTTVPNPASDYTSEAFQSWEEFSRTPLYPFTHIAGWYISGQKFLILDAPPFDNTPIKSGDTCPITGGSEESLEDGEAQVQIGLGPSEHDQAVGSMQLVAPEPRDDIADPASLIASFAEGFDDSGTSGVRHVVDSPAGAFRQIMGGDTSGTPAVEFLAEISNTVTDAGGDYYTVKYYDSSTWDSGNDKWTTNAGDLYRTVKIIDKGNNNGETIRIEDTFESADPEITEFVWDDTNDRWVLAKGIDGTSGDAIRKEWQEESVSGDTRTVTNYISEDTTTNLLSKVVVEYRTLAGEEVMTSRKVVSEVGTPDTYASIATWEYTVSESGGPRLYAAFDNNGGWVTYEYGEDGRVARMIRQLDENAYSEGDRDALAEDNIAVVYTYDDALSVTVDATAENVVVEKMQTLVKDSVEGVSYTIHRPTPSDTTYYEQWSVRCATTTPEATAGSLAGFIADILEEDDAGGHLVSRTWKYESGEDFAFLTYRALRPDGTMSITSRTLTGTTTMMGGYPNGGLTDVVYGTKTTAVDDVRGNMVSRKVEKISQDANSGNYFVVSYTAPTITDGYGRPLTTAYYFGAEASAEAASGSGTAAYTTVMTYNCCGSNQIATSTNRAGVETMHTYDELQRQTVSIQHYGATQPIWTVRKYDAASRVVESGISGDRNNELSRAADDDHVTTMVYDLAGRQISTKDPEGRMSYTTYNRVDADGDPYDLDTDTGPFYWETRRYGHDNTLPVSVSWTDSQGRNVLSFTASTTATWNEAGPPSGVETLVERSRSMPQYEWVDQGGGDYAYETESWSFFDLPASVGLNATVTEGTHYLVTGKTEYDELGRGYRRTDAAGNITETLYEFGTGRVFGMRAGVTEGNLSIVSLQYYKLFELGDDSDDPTGHDRPWVTRSYSVKPNLLTAPLIRLLGGDPLQDYVYVETYEAFEVTANALVNSHRGAVPQHGPWSKSTANAQGQGIYQRTYKEDSTTHILSQSEQAYITAATHNGLPEYSYAYEVDGSGAVTGDYLRTSFFYDDASRRVKAQTDGRGFTKTEFDDYGRTERTVFCSEEGSNTTVYGANAFTDDIVLSESVPTYDKSGLTLYSTSYSRNHDDTTTIGLLSAAASSVSRVSYSANWYDANGRPTQSATYGTNGFAAFSYETDPNDIPDPDDLGRTDEYLVNKTEYDDAGRPYITTDNSGKKTRVFFDDMGRTTHTIENWDGTLGTPDTPGSRDADENRVTAYIYDNSTTGGGVRIQLIAIDPDSDGVYSDNQVTEYIHSGELNVAKRGPVRINGRPVTTLMPDALEDGETRAGAITKINNGTSGGDFTLTKFYANGQPYKMTDARGVEWTYAYTDEGWLDHRRVTDTGTPAVGGDLRFGYTYGDLGEVLTITSYSDAAGTTETSQVSYAYDGFYNQVTETQDLDPTANSGAGNPQTITRAFDDTATANVFDQAYRPTGVTYPNGREIDLVYGTSGGIDDNIGRVVGLDDSTPGSVLGDYEITRYSYLGSGAMVRKDYTVPDLRLDFVDESGEGSSSTDPYDTSFDRFGRALRYQWETYDGSGNADESRIEIAHAYDRASNRLYDQRTVYPGHSKVFAHDDLDRIDDVETGEHNGNASSPAIESFWKLEDQGWALDALGNPLEASDLNNPNMFETDVNDANEVTERRFDTGSRLRSEDDFSSDSSADWDMPGSNDVMAISGGVMKFTTVAQDTSGSGIDDPTAQAIAFLGENIGPAQIQTHVKFPSGATTGEAGIVFGYKGPTDYWLRVMNLADQKVYVYKVEDQGGTAVRVLKDSTNWSITAGTSKALPTNARSNALVYPNYLSLDSEGGYPAGKIGLYSTVADAEFDYLFWNPTERSYNGRGRWSSYSQAGFNGADDRLNVIANAQSNWTPVLLDHLTAKNFEATFRFTRTATTHSFSSVRLVFNATSIDDYDAIQVRLDTTGSAVAPLGTECVDGLQDVSVTQTRVASNVPLAPGGEMWARVISDGTELKVFCALTESGLDTAVTNDTYAYSSSDFDMVGGQIGVCAAGGHTALNDFKLKMDLNDDGDFTDTGETQLIEDFVDVGGFGELEPEYDAAGNLTFDGTRKFTYDAQNRLIKVQYAYLSTSPGATLAEYRYDALGRRIEEKAYLGGELDNVSHHYYLGWSVIETRNGSDQVVTQHVWDNLSGGGHYIDSLAEVTHNLNPGFDEAPGTSGTQDYCETRLFAMQDQQFNVMGLVTANGTLAERYEYTLYGKRQVYRAAGEDIGAILNADIDNDGDVDSDDFNILDTNSGTSITAGDRAKGDLDGDGDIDSDDEDLLLAVQGGPGDGNDPLCHAPALNSATMPFSAAPLCSIGFQGLRLDETTGLIDNRARVYDPDQQRFLQGDPLGYPDGMDSYAAYHVLRGGLDADGRQAWDPNYTHTEKAPNDGSWNRILDATRNMQISGDNSNWHWNRGTRGRRQTYWHDEYNKWRRRTFQLNWAAKNIKLRGEMEIRMSDATVSPSNAKMLPGSDVVIKWHAPDGGVTCCDEVRFVQYEETDYHRRGYDEDTSGPDEGRLFYDNGNVSPWTPSNVYSFAEMGDSPGGEHNKTYWIQQEFVTAAVCTKGEDTGVIYGIITWGHEFTHFGTSTSQKFNGERWARVAGETAVETGVLNDPRVSDSSFRELHARGGSVSVPSGFHAEFDSLVEDMSLLD